jgi:hypothetical protein
MTVDASQLLLDVYNAVAEVGRNVTVTVYTDTYNTTSGKTTRTPASYTVLSSPLYNQNRSIVTDTQPRGTANLLVPASGVTFSLVAGSKVLAGAKAYTVTTVERLEIGSTLLAYVLTLQDGSP